MRHGRLDEPFRRNVRAQVVHLDAAALKDDLHQILADVVHIAPHCPDAGRADGGAAAALVHHIGLQQRGGGSHAAGGDEHLRHEGAAGGKVLAQLVHAPYQPAGENILGVHAALQRLLDQRQQLFLLPPPDGGGDSAENVTLGGCVLPAAADAVRRLRMNAAPRHRR